MRNKNVLYQYITNDGRTLEYDPMYGVASYLTELTPTRLSDIPTDTGKIRDELKTKYKAIQDSKPSPASGSGNEMVPYNSKFKFRPDKKRRC